MLQAPNDSPYDLRFQFLGFPVRISWSFWIGAIIFGHQLAQSFDRGFQELSPGMGPLLVTWVACLFVSILIHELGHALAFRQFGIYSTVVLYHFGGLAIPIGTSMPGRSLGRIPPRQDLWITFAGPLAQFVSAIVVMVLLRVLNYQIPDIGLGIHELPGISDGEKKLSPPMYAAAYMYLWPSVFWAFLNLLPVLPLDGGRIAQALILIFGGTRLQALWLSVITAALVGGYAFTNDHTFMGFFFLMFGVGCFQQIQQSGGWRY